MALFGDSPRFHENRQHCNQSNNFLKAQTPSHVGPGSSYSMEAEDVRGGWKSSKSPNKHQPMDSTAHRDMYLDATLTRDGQILHKDPKKQSFPSTGQYDPMQIFSPGRKRADHPPLSPRSRPGEERYMSSSSPRLLDCQLRKGVIVTSSPRELLRQSSIGPGSYFSSDGGDAPGSSSNNTLLKKSHNRRVSGGNEKGYANRSNPSTPRSRSKSTGHTRPQSADSSGSYFKQYTTNNLRTLPSPILQTPPKRFAAPTYNHSGGNGHSGNDGYSNTHGGPQSNGQLKNDSTSPITPFVVSPKRGIPIGRVYN